MPGQKRKSSSRWFGGIATYFGGVTKGQKETLREEFGSHIYRTYLQVWVRAGGSDVVCGAKPSNEPKRLEWRDAEMRSLRRQITMKTRGASYAAKRLAKLQAASKVKPLVQSSPPKLRVRLPRQNYGDDT